MYGYFDESIIELDGVKYVTVGAIFYENICKENTVNRVFSKIKKEEFKKEIKYKNIRNQRVRGLVLKEIKHRAIFYLSKTKRLENDIHDTINILLIDILHKAEKEIIFKNLKIIYDRSTYKINVNDIKNKFDFVNSFEMRDSARYFGIQHADWIAGEGSENFKLKQIKN